MNTETKIVETQERKVDWNNKDEFTHDQLMKELERIGKLIGVESETIGWTLFFGYFDKNIYDKDIQMEIMDDAARIKIKPFFEKIERKIIIIRKLIKFCNYNNKINKHGEEYHSHMEYRHCTPKGKSILRKLFDTLQIEYNIIDTKFFDLEHKRETLGYYNYSDILDEVKNFIDECKLFMNKINSYEIKRTQLRFKGEQQGYGSDDDEFDEEEGEYDEERFANYNYREIIIHQYEEDENNEDEEDIGFDHDMIGLYPN